MTRPAASRPGVSAADVTTDPALPPVIRLADHRGGKAKPPHPDRGPAVVVPFVRRTQAAAMRKHPSGRPGPDPRSAS